MWVNDRLELSEDLTVNRYRSAQQQMEKGAARLPCLNDDFFQNSG